MDPSLLTRLFDPDLELISQRDICLYVSVKMGSTTETQIRSVAFLMRQKKLLPRFIPYHSKLVCWPLPPAVTNTLAYYDNDARKNYGADVSHFSTAAGLECSKNIFIDKTT